MHGRYIFSLMTAVMILSTNSVLSKEWTDLTSKEKELWIKSASFVKLEDSMSSSENKYRYNRRLESSLASKGYAGTTVSAALKQFIELDSAYKYYLGNKELTLPDPSITEIEEQVSRYPLVYNTTKTVDLQSIFIRKFDNESTLTALQRANEAVHRLKKGEAFESVALDVSEARSASFGGTVGTVRYGQISSELEEIIFTAPVREIVGPVASGKGFHILRLMKGNEPFSLTNESDADRVRSDLRKSKLGRMMESLGEEWAAKNKPIVYDEPKDKSDWMNQPWIQWGNGNHLSFGYIFYAMFQKDITVSGKSDWTDEIKEEAGIRARLTYPLLAARDELADSKDLKIIIDLLEPEYALQESLRLWYSELEPTEAELEETYKNSMHLLPSYPLYSYLLWETRISEDLPADKIGIEYSKVLNQVYDLTSNTKPQNLDDVASVYKLLKDTFPGSRATSHTLKVANSPAMEALLTRSKLATLSRPFDSGLGVAVVYVLEKKEQRPNLQDYRSAVTEIWRAKQLEILTESVKKSIK